MKYTKKTNFSAATFSALSVAILATLSSSASMAAGGGGNAGGKPFVQLENQIIEVQNSVTQTFEEQVQNLTQVVMTSDTALEGRVSMLETQVSSLETRLSSVEDVIDATNIALDDLEKRVGVTETNIGLLQTKAANQQGQIEKLIADALATGIDIVALEAQLASVNQQITILQTTTGDHTSDIAALELQASSLKSQIETNASGITGLRTDLANTNSLVNALQGELNNLKNQVQQLMKSINYTCPAGSAFTQINSATYYCEGLHSVRVVHGAMLATGNGAPYLTGTTCPNDTVLSGGGVEIGIAYGHPYIPPHVSRPDHGNPNTWLTGTMNPGTYWTTIICLKVGAPINGTGVISQ